MKQVSTKKRKSRLSFSFRKNAYGYLFILPFIIGFVFFLAYPIIQSLMFSFSELKVGAEGFTLINKGLENFKRALLVDVNFRDTFIESITTMLANVPLIMIFSFFCAALLSQKFPGRTVARVFFFLPVIIASGAALGMDATELVQNMLGNVAPSTPERGASVAYGLFNVNAFLINAGVNQTFTGYIVTAIDHITQLVSYSGVQILIFLAGIQTVPTSLYEASSIEGATSWENFWKITFPMISPLVLVNMIYTIIDSFTMGSNTVMDTIMSTIKDVNYGLASAMAWLYFVVIFVIIVVVTFIGSRLVFYYE